MPENDTPIRIGVIGAGGIFRSRHLPGLQAIDGVDLVAVCNRGQASSTKAQREWGFTRIETDWRKLVRADDIDAVMIGTWPYTHREMSVEALEAGKHVFCQARMASDLTEAEAMAAAADRRADRVSLICPPPSRMPYEPYVKKLMAEAALGELREAHLDHFNAANLGELNWRERTEHSGQQIMAVGIWAETLHAWLGEYAMLSASTATPITSKPDPDNGGAAYDIAIPQIVHLHGHLQSGMPMSERHVGVSRHDQRSELTVVGSEKTLRVRLGQGAHMDIEMAEGDGDFESVEPPEDLTYGWRVEAEFIDAVCAASSGEDWRSLPRLSPDFHEGLKYMKKIDAIHRSSLEGQSVTV